MKQHFNELIFNIMRLDRKSCMCSWSIFDTQHDIIHRIDRCSFVFSSLNQWNMTKTKRIYVRQASPMEFRSKSFMPMTLCRISLSIVFIRWSLSWQRGYMLTQCHYLLHDRPCQYSPMCIRLCREKSTDELFEWCWMCQIKVNAFFFRLFRSSAVVLFHCHSRFIRQELCSSASSMIETIEYIEVNRDHNSWTWPYQSYYTRNETRHSSPRSIRFAYLWVSRQLSMNISPY
jgi:hypothetical protein